MWIVGFVCFIWGCLEAKSSRYIYLDSPQYIGGAGLFHNFNIVLGCLDLYDTCDYLGLKVDFGQEGLYYDPAYGDNWWNYYFEPIHYLPRNPCKGRSIIKRFNDQEKGELGNAAQFYMTRARARELIERYIHVKQEILDQVEMFYTHNLKGHKVISVHYRGTDKVFEAYPVEFTKVIQAIPIDADSRVFVATDEPAFLTYIQGVFPGKVYHTDAQKIAGKPVHYTSSHCFLKGKEALIDCLLLAKGDLLVRTNSNLSTVAAYFNPHMPVISLNTITDELYEGISRKGMLNELNKR